jgi:TPR repeat protein
MTMIDNGLLGEEDKKPYVNHLLQAYSENSDIQYTLGSCYYHGRLGLPRDHTLAFQHWNDAANKGHDHAIIQLAMAYYNGIEQICSIDHDKSRQLWMKAIETKTPYSYHQYGLALMNGNGAPENKEEAAKYLLLAVNSCMYCTVHCLPP